MSTVRILLADEHAVVRFGLRYILERCPEWKICGEAATGQQAIALAVEMEPDVMVMDAVLPGLAGLEAIKQIKKIRPHVEIVIFTSRTAEELVTSAFESGARSCLLQTDDDHSVVEAVQAAAQHKPYFTARTTEVMCVRFEQSFPGAGKPAPGHLLSGRERQTLQLVAEGLTNKEIASKLGVGTRTAESHRAALMRKLKLNSAAEVVRYAIRNSIIEA